MRSLRTTSSRTYAGYLELDSLLDLQRPVTEWRDETLFIVVHQVYELWFKLLIDEISVAVRSLAPDQESVWAATTALDRCFLIERIMFDQFQLLDTMDPVGFAELRVALSPASGHESEQFGELLRLSVGADWTSGLWGAFCNLATRWGRSMPVGDGHEVVRRASLRGIYCERTGSDGVLWALGEKLLTHDANISLWRYRHLLSANRQIGGQRGTGGLTVVDLSAHVDRYLYPDLWAVRDSVRAEVRRSSSTSKEIT